jgi:hypothetical protein
MNIFIPVLFICVNDHCEFMQASRYERSEKECRTSIETQKQHMRNLVKEAGQGTVQILEGTCIDVETNTIDKKVKLNII